MGKIGVQIYCKLITSTSFWSHWWWFLYLILTNISVYICTTIKHRKKKLFQHLNSIIPSGQTVTVKVRNYVLEMLRKSLSWNSAFESMFRAVLHTFKRKESVQCVINIRLLQCILSPLVISLHAKRLSQIIKRLCSFPMLPQQLPSEVYWCAAVFDGAGVITQSVVTVANPVKCCCCERMISEVLFINRKHRIESCLNCKQVVLLNHLRSCKRKKKLKLKWHIAVLISHFFRFSQIPTCENFVWQQNYFS